MKKIISLLLVLVMVFSMTAFASAASMPNDVYHSKNREAIETLYHYGILEGHGNGKYMPKDTLTRAEACAMITRAMLVDENIEPSYRSYFSDVTKTWQRKYIDTAVRHDYMHGYGDGTFGPEDEVTYAQFATIVLNMLGYNAPELDGTWPENTEEIADVLKIYYNTTNHELNDAITREDAAQMIYNALDCYVVEWVRGEIRRTSATLADVIVTDYTYSKVGVVCSENEDIQQCTRVSRNAWFVINFIDYNEFEVIYAPVVDFDEIHQGDIVEVTYDHNSAIEVEVLKCDHEDDSEADDENDTNTDTDEDEETEPKTVTVYVSNPDDPKAYHMDKDCHLFAENNREAHEVTLTEEELIGLKACEECVFYTAEGWTRYHLKTCKYVIEADEGVVVPYNPSVHTQTPCKICFPVE